MDDESVKAKLQKEKDNDTTRTVRSPLRYAMNARLGLEGKEREGKGREEQRGC
jgi:hypothetical protein